MFLCPFSTERLRVTGLDGGGRISVRKRDRQEVGGTSGIMLAGNGKGQVLR
jgi:hypothetical protein